MMDLEKNMKEKRCVHNYDCKFMNSIKDQEIGCR